jgi:hypothetical protein
MMRGHHSRIRSWHQVHSAGALDFTDDLPVNPCGDACDTPWDEFAGLSGELGQQLWVLVGQLFHRDVHAAAWQAAIGLAKGDEAFLGLGLHDGLGIDLADLTVKRALLHEVIELHLLKTTRSASALLVAGGDVA